MNLYVTKVRACGTLAVIAAVAASAGPAQASGEPAGGCAGPYKLFPIPRDGSRPVAEGVDARGNTDGFACQKPTHDGSSYNVIDNRVQS